MSAMKPTPQASCSRNGSNIPTGSGSTYAESDFTVPGFAPVRCSVSTARFRAIAIVLTHATRSAAPRTGHLPCAHPSRTLERSPGRRPRALAASRRGSAELTCNRPAHRGVLVFGAPVAVGLMGQYHCPNGNMTEFQGQDKRGKSLRTGNLSTSCKRPAAAETSVCPTGAGRNEFARKRRRPAQCPPLFPGRIGGEGRASQGSLA